MPGLYFYRNKSFIALIIFLTISIGLMIFNANFKMFNIRSVFFFITYPFEYVVSAAGGFFAGFFTDLAESQNIKEELTDTKKRLKVYQEKLLLYSQILKENAQLKQILQIKENLEFETTYAKIIFRDPTLLSDYYIIDKGFWDGISNNMPVVSYESNGEIFLVGKTIEVNPSASKVKLVTSHNFYMGVALKESGYMGILSGHGSWNQGCMVDYVPIEAEIYIGEGIITSGGSDIFPEGISVGRVSGIEKSINEEFFKKLYITPQFNISKVQDVFVLHWKPNPEIKKLMETNGQQ